MIAPLLDRNVLRRIACANVRVEVRRLRGTSSRPLPVADWPDGTSIGEDGLGLDSLERLGVLGALAEIFLLDDDTLPDEPPERVGDWIDWVERSRRSGPTALAVRTSGSTGAPKSCLHDTVDLLGEANHLATRFPQCRRVVAMVPASHLYGIVWATLLPASLGVAVVDRVLGSPLGLLPGDMLVAVPDQWEAILRMHIAVPVDCVAVSSAGTMGDRLGIDLLASGFRRVVDVYGSSETGAIAMRDVPSAGYELLPRWELLADGHDWQIVDRNGGIRQLPDHVERLGQRCIRPTGRRDGAVKVGGHNVWPERVRGILREVDGVADVAVRLGENGRLKAFVVPKDPHEVATLLDVLERVAGERLEVAERPRAFRFGATLPRNDMGKLADWT